jgi:hypothetical protein
LRHFVEASARTMAEGLLGALCCTRSMWTPRGVGSGTGHDVLVQEAAPSAFPAADSSTRADVLGDGVREQRKPAITLRAVDTSRRAGRSHDETRHFLVGGDVPRFRPPATRSQPFCAVIRPRRPCHPSNW